MNKIFVNCFQGCIVVIVKNDIWRAKIILFKSTCSMVFVVYRHHTYWYNSYMVVVNLA